MSRVSIPKMITCFLLIIINGCIPALSAQSLAESNHPYSNDIDKKWTVSEPGASEIRLHFKDLQLAKYDGDGYDKVLILDRFDNVVETYGGYSGVNSQDFWTDWYKGDKLTIELVTDKTRPCYGFVVDQKDFNVDGNDSAESNSLAESDHPYANDIDKKWTVSKPGASEIRLHFKDLQLAKYDGDGYDKVLILDRYDNVVETYGGYSGVNSQDFWTDWYKGDKLTIELVTDKTRPCYGFVVDQKDFKMDNNTSENVVPENPNTPEPTETQTDTLGTSGKKILTATELTTSANPSLLGQPVTVIAKVDTPSQVKEKPYGTVTFMDGTTPLGAFDVISGQATMVTSSLSAGSHSITANYNGDGNCKPSTSSVLALTVQEQASPTEQPDTEPTPKIGENVTGEQTYTIPSQTDKEPIWENLIFQVLVGIILIFIEIYIKRKKK